MSAVRELGDLPAIFRAAHWPRQVIERHQAAGVRSMLDHARRTVPHYAADDRFHPEAVLRLDGLADLPVLRKTDVLAEGPERYRSSGVAAADVVMTPTSGTSGRRLDVAHDRRHYAYHNAACLRRFLATEAYRPWYRLSHLRPMGMPTRWYQRLGLFRRHLVLISWSHERIRDELLAARPQALIAYPTSLRDLVRRLSDGELDRLRSTLRVVFTESELLVPAHRAQLSEALGAPIFDEYSSYETLNISFECAAGSAHVAEDRVVVEIVGDDDRPVAEGEEGTVVVTAFQERAMPFVRYWLGDRARWVPGDCACGRTFRRLQLTTGRVDHNVTLPDGSMLSVGAFLLLAAEHPGVAESAVRQGRDGAITVLLVPDEDGERDFDAVARSYVSELQELARRRFPVAVERADRVHLTEGGKGRFLESSYRP